MTPSQYDEDALIPKSGPSSEASDRFGRCRVVYLDDDSGYADLLKLSLSRLGHEVLTFTRPDEALAAIASPDSEVDAFISDFNLPGQSGIEVAMEARRICPNLPRAVITSHFRDVVALAQEADILAMTKPALVPEFEAMLARVLAQA